jgi:twinkle protein
MNYSEHNIEIPNGRISGEVYTTCPNCSKDRKKKSVKCLGVNLDKQVWNCNHCGWKGAIKQERMEKPTYIKPEWRNRTELSEKVVKWFEGRGISQDVLKSMQITEGITFIPQKNANANTIQFNYFRDGELINVKYRTGDKCFKLHKGSELIFYNLDSAKDNEEIYIVEGEMDALSFIQAGVKNVLSVPNGANLNTNNLTYLDNSIDALTHLKTIVLATDNDNAGRRLRDELAVRFGIYRCKYIDWGEYKDANDVLQNKGISGIHSALAQVKDFPLEGAFTISDYDLDIQDMYENGLDAGQKIGMEELDKHISFVKGYITGVTGIPGHGKSDVVDQITLKLIINAGWKGAYFSPENKPTKLHFSKMARKVTGKSWQGNNRMSLTELEQVKQYLEGKVWFVKPEKDYSLQSIMSIVRNLKQRHGIDFFVIDAWNKLEHKYTDNESKYIGQSLDELAVFCEEVQVHCFLVAHPKKMLKDKDSGSYQVPNLYDISGSANFFNKMDNGISVYRVFADDNKTSYTEVHIQKVKFSHWGSIGMVEYDYHLPSGRYISRSGARDEDNWITKAPAKIQPNMNFDLTDKNDLPF